MAHQVHIVGGGLAGLSAATRLATTPWRVQLYEAGPACGGRARSFDDSHLGCRIDNGNHLLLSANHATMTYLDRIGARGTLTGPGAPFFPFMDLKTHERWVLRLPWGRIPWPLLSKGGLLPGMKLRELYALVRLMRAREGAATVEELLPRGMLRRRLLEPLAVSGLNTPCHEASAALFGAVLRETLSRGGRACVPLFASEGLSESFVQPALEFLSFMHAKVRTGCRVQGLSISGGAVRALHHAHGQVELGAQDRVILAVNAPVAQQLLRGAGVGVHFPDSFESIINVHFRPAVAPRPMGALARAGFIGLVGGLSEWIFVRNGVISITISAANARLSDDQDDLVRRIWAEVCTALNPMLAAPLSDDMPPVRFICEKRATFAATPAQNRLRPGPLGCGVSNLLLAGDWTQTGLPSTIEGAIRSGAVAAQLTGAV